MFRFGVVGVAVTLGVSITSTAPASTAPAPTALAAEVAPNARSGATGPTVYDSSLGVYWLADVDLASTDTFGVKGVNKDGSMDYQTAVAWVKAMNAADGGKGYLDHTDWTLPTTPSNDPGCQSKNVKGGGTFGFNCSKSGMGSLYYHTLELKWPATAVPISAHKTGPFTNFQPYLYWTATSPPKEPNGFETFSFNTGWSGSNVDVHDMYVLPMIKGNPFGTKTRAGTRLQSSTNGATVYDRAAGVTWLANADLAATENFSVTGIAKDGSMEETTAVRWVVAMNKRAWLGQSHWQLPTATPCGGYGCDKGELGQLYYDGLGFSRGTSAVATPNTDQHGIRDIQPYLYWSCAGQTIRGPCAGAPAPGFAWSFSFGNGFEGTDLVQNDLYAMAYYPAAG